MLYEQYAKELDTKNNEMLADLCYPAFEIIMHFPMPFPNGTKNTIFNYIEEEDDLVLRIETGSLPLKPD